MLTFFGTSETPSFSFLSRTSSFLLLRHSGFFVSSDAPIVQMLVLGLWILFSLLDSCRLGDIVFAKRLWSYPTKLNECNVVCHNATVVGQFPALYRNKIVPIHPVGRFWWAAGTRKRSKLFLGSASCSGPRPATWPVQPKQAIESASKRATLKYANVPEKQYTAYCQLHQSNSRLKPRSRGQVARQSYRTVLMV
jgi:hypothetical protein